MTNSVRFAQSAAAAVALSVAAIPLASPAQARTTTADAVVRAAHFSPTTPGLDVYLSSFGGKTSTEWLSGVHYGSVSGYRQLVPGLYTVSMRRHGAPATATPVLSWTLDAHAGAAYTVAGVGADSDVHGVVLDDSLTAPASGDGRVRVIQAASRAPVLSVRAADGPTIVKSAHFASATSYSSVAAGRWTVVAASDADPAVRASSTVQIRSGQISSVLVLDAKGHGITVRALVDSAAASAPSGPVPAGGGGTATSFVNAAGPDRTLSPGLIGVVGAVLAVVLFGLGRPARRYRSRHGHVTG